jgi:hypothetical protein
MDLLARSGSEAQKTEQLVLGGRPGAATILAARPTGAIVGGHPQLELDLEVRVPGLGPYRVTHRQVVATAASTSFAPGARVPVRVDPHDPRSLIVA